MIPKTLGAFEEVSANPYGTVTRGEAENWLKGKPDYLEEDGEVDIEALMEAPGDGPAISNGWMPPWRMRAGCRKLGWAYMADPENVEAAKAVCEACPVRKQCLEFALDNEPTVAVWGGMTFEERARTCPICLGPKDPTELGCDFGHTLLRLARLTELQALGDPDVTVSLRQRPTARTNPDCVVARGMSHTTASAYKRGCRCEAAREDRNEEQRYFLDRQGTRVPYGTRHPKDAA